MLTEFTKQGNQVKRKLERLITKMEKYPHQITREDKDFLAKALAVKSFIEKKKEQDEATENSKTE